MFSCMVTEGHPDGSSSYHLLPCHNNGPTDKGSCPYVPPLAAPNASLACNYGANEPVSPQPVPSMEHDPSSGAGSGPSPFIGTWVGQRVAAPAIEIAESTLRYLAF